MKKYEFKPDKPRSGFISKLFLTQKQRRSVLKWSLYALVLVLLSVVQDVFFSRVRLWGGTTELVVCGIFLVCLLEGVEKGSVFALAAAFCYLFSGSAAGYYSVVFITVLAVLVTAFRQSYLQRGFGAALLCTAMAMLLYEVAVFLITVFLGLTRWGAFPGFVITAALSLLAVPVLYPVFSLIGGNDQWNE
ncbi:MAG: hypothetical protein IJZ56_03065 [Oscillospiraceae bacterium]|nr:hypothetical protein [Oscillospiraceae bacterium]